VYSRVGGPYDLESSSMDPKKEVRIFSARQPESFIKSRYAIKHCAPNEHIICCAKVESMTRCMARSIKELPNLNPFGDIGSERRNHRSGYNVCPSLPLRPQEFIQPRRFRNLIIVNER
jgi:hypothetical protein